MIDAHRPPFAVRTKGEPLRKGIPVVPANPGFHRSGRETVEDSAGQLYIAIPAVQVQHAIARRVGGGWRVILRERLEVHLPPFARHHRALRHAQTARTRFVKPVLHAEFGNIPRLHLEQVVVYRARPVARRYYPREPARRLFLQLHQQRIAVSAIARQYLDPVAARRPIHVRVRVRVENGEVGARRKFARVAADASDLSD